MAGAAQPVPSEPQKTSAADRVDSWKEIAAYLKRSVRTVHRWESEQGLPVRRHLHQSSGTVYAFKSELDRWWANRKIEAEAAGQSREESPFAASESRSTAALPIAVGAIVVIVALLSMSHFRDRLFGRANPPTIRSVAVLPLKNLAGDTAHEYLGDYMTVQHWAPLMGLRPMNPEANRLLYKGLVTGGREGYQGFSDGITYFEQAITRQPDFAGAYSAMSLFYIQFSFVGPLAPEEFMPKAEAAARRALELDEGLAEAHAALGITLYRYYWNWSGAEGEFRRAVEQNPNFAEGHRMFAAFLAAAGRSEQALAEAQRARELDPLSVQTLLNLAAASRAIGHYDQAVAELREALQRYPQLARAHFQLGTTYLEKGDLNEGATELESAVKLSGGNPRFVAYLGYADAVSGKQGDAQEILNKLKNLARQQYVSPVGIARIYMGLGEKEKVLAWLERAYQTHDDELTGIATDHGLDALHSNPHFQDLLQRIGLAR
jgi:tetratricopeptide (TPR) repeat protein